MTTIACIEDLRVKAKRNVPRMFYEYVDGGSWSESTYRANEKELSKIKFRQRVARDVTLRTSEMSMLGQHLPMPVALSPIGLAGMQIADGEIKAAQAAEKFGVPFTLSTMSICSIEDVAANSSKPFWFQLYVMRDREFVSRLIQRAKDANCSALMVTLDLQLMGQRHKDIRNGLSAPPKMTLKNIYDLLSKPHWCIGMLATKRRYFGNIVGHVQGVKDMSSLADWTVSQFDPSLSWDDVAEIKKQWDGKFIIKGILDPEDARAAINVGADAIVVSNHGGRQLDGAISTVEALPQIVEAVNGKCEVWMDGGIRSGQDVLRAIALGANGTMIGRAFIYGLGASGSVGVSQALEIIKTELDLTLGLCGQSNLGNVDSSILFK